jgi:alkylated DNA repair dioxygenase AlkB
MFIFLLSSFTFCANNLNYLMQDRDESRESLRKGLPVVSFSIGDSAEFLYGDQRNIEKAENVFLESGDVLIFGGESRHVYHGVSSIIPNSAPEELLQDTCLCPGRLNLTFRQY